MKTVTVFGRSAPIQRRARLVRATRRAFLHYGVACERFHERNSALTPSVSCIREAGLTAEHKKARLERLENALVAATGLPLSAVRNDISARWPVCPNLLADV